MRLTIPTRHSGQVRWSALREHSMFLYRRVADRDLAVLGVGARAVGDEVVFDADGAVHDWCFGHLSYDLKDCLEDLGGTRTTDPELPLSCWFVPRWVVEWRKGDVLLHAHPEDVDEGMALLEALHDGEGTNDVGPALDWELKTSRERYLARTQELLRHIQLGDIYEVNYCTTREACSPGWDVYSAFGRLLERTEAPFAGFYRLGHRFALCASPERFLAFDGDRVMAQPMKGTRPRSSDPVEDARLASELASDGKERSENIMAVDVIRNDLSRIAASGSVAVEELCGVHSYTRVHQMVSTVVARLGSGRRPWDAVMASFPMASMTGAPKIKAMELIDGAEDRARGLFSGSLGYFAPDGTGDLNVVIRTLLHDSSSGLLTLTTGSALTAACDPEEEWAECDLKARSVIDALWT
jgi:para-aminobenzoate synthetase component I